MEKKYTLADLAEALRRDSDTDRHSNPGRTRRRYLQDQANVTMIRAKLIEQGDLADPAQSPEAIEKRRVQNSLDQLHPNAKSWLRVEFEGQLFTRRCSKVSDVWFGRWQKS